MKRLTGLFQRKRNTTLGVNICGETARIVGLSRRTGPGYILRAAGEIPLPFECIGEDGSVLAPRDIVYALEETTHQFQGEYISATIRGDMLTILHLTLPAMKAAQLESALLWEAENLFGQDSNQLVLDYLVMGDAAEKSDDQMNIMLAAVPRDLAWQYYDVLVHCGLKPISLEIEPIALARALSLMESRKTPKETQALIDLDRDYINFALLRGAQLLYAQSFQLGKIGGPRNHTGEGVSFWLDSLMSQIIPILDHYRKDQGLDIGMGILTGVGANEPGLMEAAQTDLNLPLIKGEIHLDTAEEKILLAPQFSIAAGLASGFP
ncbi:MAG: pilus assembly protein PilM [Clostridia bacterium]|nr:pilus assembly protein PilM [Clostridia bacterium]